MCIRDSAIGDRGNHFVLNTYSRVLGKNNNKRWRIEHAQMVEDSDIDKFLNDIEKDKTTKFKIWSQGFQFSAEAYKKKIKDECFRLLAIATVEDGVSLINKIFKGEHCPTRTKHVFKSKWITTDPRNNLK